MHQPELTFTPSAPPLTIGATGMDAITQNIRMIVTTLAYSTPLDRGFASTGSFIDAPSPYAVMIQPLRDLFGWVGEIPIVGDAFRGIGRMLGFGGEEQEDFVGSVMPKGYVPPADTIAPQTAEQQKAAQAAQQQMAGANGAGAHGAASSAQSAPRSTSAPQASRQASSPTSTGVSVTQHFTLNGITDADFARRVIAALEAKKGDIERLISSMVNDAGRLTYGS